MNSPGATSEDCLEEEGRGDDEDEEEEEMAALKAEEHEGEMRGPSKGRKARGAGEGRSLKQPSQQKSGASSSSTDKEDTVKSLCSAFRMPFCRCGHVMSTWLAGVLNPFFLQSFGLTFVAEWGDRSQISTFALAADRSVAGVFVGKKNFILPTILDNYLWISCVSIYTCLYTMHVYRDMCTYLVDAVVGLSGFRFGSSAFVTTTA